MVDKVIRIKIDSSGASRNIRNLDGEMRNLGQSADQTSQAFGKLKSVAQAVVGALATQQIIKYADAFTSIQNQIRQTVTSTEELTQRTGELLEVANRSRGEFGTVAELYTQLNLSTQELGLSSSELLRVTETISKSFAVSGKSAAESAGAIRQLAQGLAAGALRGDEFNSVAEGAPEIMRALQRELKMNQGELREFAATGGITSKILIQALGNAGDVIDEKLNNSIATLSQKMTIAENNMTQFIGSAQSVQGAVGKMGDVVVTLSENLDTIANVVLIAAIAGFGKLSAMVIMNTVETVKNTAAKIANANATTGLSAALGVQAQRMTAATIAMRTMTAAGTALRGVMAFLGGPLGIAITAASAIAFFATTADDATSPTGSLAGKVDDLTKAFEDLTEAERRTKIEGLSVQIAGLEAELTATNEKLDNFTSKSRLLRGSEVAFQRNKERAQELKEEIAKLSAEMEALENKAPNFGKLFEEWEVLNKLQSGGETQDAAVSNREKFRTEALKNELAERIRLNQIFNENVVSMNMNRIEAMRAQEKMQHEAALARLERDRADTQLRFQEERESILANEKISQEQRMALLNELKEQEKIQNMIFMQEERALELEHQQQLTEIQKQAIQERLENEQRAGEMSMMIEHQTRQAILGFMQQFSGQSKTLAKALVLLRAAEGVQSAIINSQVAATRALAELGPIAGPPVAAKMIAYGKISAGIIAANAALKLGASGGGGGSTPSIGLGSSSASVDTPRRQEVPQQTTSIEFRGLAEVAAELRNLDPNETLPVEYTQRIVASLAEFERLSGGGD